MLVACRLFVSCLGSDVVSFMCLPFAVDPARLVSSQETAVVGFGRCAFGVLLYCLLLPVVAFFSCFVLL